MKTTWYIYARRFYQTYTEWDLAICLFMNESGGQYVKWNKSDIERRMLRHLSCMWNLKRKSKKKSGFWSEEELRGHIGQA
jgi:hypothetical protein